MNRKGSRASVVVRTTCNAMALDLFYGPLISAAIGVYQDVLGPTRQ